MVDYLEGKKKVTGSYYTEVQKKLLAALVKKLPGKLHGGILFHHDSAPAHSSRVVREFVPEFRWEMFPHLPYSPDLTPSDFFLLPKLKDSLKGTPFTSIVEAKQAVNTWFDTKSYKFIRRGLETWKHRLMKCIEVEGHYIEK